MADATLVDLVKIVNAGSGTGALILGVAVTSFRGREALVDGHTYHYSIQQGNKYELGTGVYDAGDQTLTRGVLVSSHGGDPISLAANAVIAFPAFADDFGEPGPPGPQGPIGPNPGPGSAAYYHTNLQFELKSQMLALFGPEDGVTAAVWNDIDANNGAWEYDQTTTSWVKFSNLINAATDIDAGQMPVYDDGTNLVQIPYSGLNYSVRWNDGRIIGDGGRVPEWRAMTIDLQFNYATGVSDSGLHTAFRVRSNGFPVFEITPPTNGPHGMAGGTQAGGFRLYDAYAETATAYAGMTMSAGVANLTMWRDTATGTDMAALRYWYEDAPNHNVVMFSTGPFTGGNRLQIQNLNGATVQRNGNGRYEWESSAAALRLSFVGYFLSDGKTMDFNNTGQPTPVVPFSASTTNQSVDIAQFTYLSGGIWNPKSGVRGSGQLWGIAGLAIGGNSGSLAKAAGHYPNLKVVKNIRTAATGVTVGHNDLYTCPAGRKALVIGFMYSNNLAGSAATSLYPELKQGASYFQIGLPVAIASGATGGTYAMGLAVFGAPCLLLAGEAFAVNADVAKTNIIGVEIWEFDDTSPLKRALLTSLPNVSPAHNTLLTVPAGKVAVVGSPVISGNTPSPGLSGIHYINGSGGARTIALYQVPSGQSPGVANGFVGQAVANAAGLTRGIWGTMGPGDSLVIDTDAATALQVLCVIYSEYDDI